jgi:hypothetical protein
MSPKLSDPHVFLQNLVTKKGKSDLFGVYLTAVTVVASANEEYEYGFDSKQVSQTVNHLLQKETNDWNSLLVSTRMNQEELIFPICFNRGDNPISVYFVAEGHEISAHVMIPQISVEEFAYEVLIFQELLNKVANFSSKVATTVRFFLGVATLDWDELVNNGEVEEIEIEY